MRAMCDFHKISITTTNRMSKLTVSGGSSPRYTNITQTSGLRYIWGGAEVGSGDATMHTLFPTLSGYDMSIYITRVTDHLPVFGRSWGARGQRPRPGGQYSVCIPYPRGALENQSSRVGTLASRIRGTRRGRKKECGEPCTAGSLGNIKVFTVPFIVGSMVRALHAVGTSGVIQPNRIIACCSTQENEATNAQNPPCGHRVPFGLSGVTENNAPRKVISNYKTYYTSTPLGSSSLQRKEHPHLGQINGTASSPGGGGWVIAEEVRGT